MFAFRRLKTKTMPEHAAFSHPLFTQIRVVDFAAIRRSVYVPSRKNEVLQTASISVLQAPISQRTVPLNSTFSCPCPYHTLVLHLSLSLSLHLPCPCHCLALALALALALVPVPVPVPVCAIAIAIAITIVFALPCPALPLKLVPCPLQAARSQKGCNTFA